MKSPGLVLLLLSCHGFGLGGQSMDVTIQWSAEERTQSARFVWELGFAHTQLASGRRSMPEKAGAVTKLTFELPKVKQRTALTLNWRVVAEGRSEPIASGRRKIRVWPTNRLATLKKRLGEHKLAVLGEAPSLSAALSRAGIDYEQGNSLPRLTVVEPAS